METLAIETHNLNKTFITRRGFWGVKTRTTLAVENISFDVNKGELFGLLGPNGAGKTTTVKMLSTLLLPTSGSINILGMDILKQTRDVRKRIGFTFGGARGLYGRLTAQENLRYFAELYAMEPAFTSKRIAVLLDLVGLSKRADERVETFSSGMQQRLHLARALLHDPELLFLDEPTVGIDPVGARELRATVKNLVSIGKTILLTTHYMAEAEELCDRIAIINHGKVVASGTPASLKKRIGKETIIEAVVERTQVSALLSALKSFEPLTLVETLSETQEDRIRVRTPDPESVLKVLGSFLQLKAVQGLEVRNQTLEDVYVAIIQGAEK